MTNGEIAYCDAVCAKDDALRSTLLRDKLDPRGDARALFVYLSSIRAVLGNISNDISFSACLLAKKYLADRFGIDGFDAAEKAQGAPGPDIDVRADDGKRIRCEITTLSPYKPGFGANQKLKIRKDLEKLAACDANIKLMVVTDPETFETLCKPYYARHARGIEIVDLITGRAYRHI